MRVDVAGRADRPLLAIRTGLAFTPEDAVGALVPPVLQHQLVAAAAGLRRLLVRGLRARVSLWLDAVAAMAVTAGRRRLGEARFEQPLAVHAGHEPREDFLVALAADLDLADRRHARLGITRRPHRVRRAMAGLAAFLRVHTLAELLAGNAVAAGADRFRVKFLFGGKRVVRCACDVDVAFGAGRVRVRLGLRGHLVVALRARRVGGGPCCDWRCERQRGEQDGPDGGPRRATDGHEVVLPGTRASFRG
jgi:hypothetical protein